MSFDWFASLMVLIVYSLGFSIAYLIIKTLNKIIAALDIYIKKNSN